MHVILGDSKVGGLVAGKDGSIEWRWADPKRQSAAEARRRGQQPGKAGAAPLVESAQQPDFSEALADAVERRLCLGVHAVSGVQIQGAVPESLQDALVAAMDRQRCVATTEEPLEEEALISAEEIERALASNHGGVSRW